MFSAESGGVWNMGRFTFFMGLGIAVVNVILYFLTDEMLFIAIATLALLFIEIHLHISDRKKLQRLMEKLNAS